MRMLTSPSMIHISALLIFAPLFEGGTTHLAVMIIRLLILSLLGFYLIHGIRAGRLEVPILPIGFVAMIFVSLAILATLLSPYQHPSVQWLLVLGSYVAFLYLLVYFATGWEHICVLVSVVVLVGLGEAAWTIAQRLLWHVPRPSGSFFNPNFLAGYLVVAWSMLLSGLIHRRGQSFTLMFSSKNHAVGILGALGALVVILIAILLTESRGGLLALLVATLFIVIVRLGWRVAAACGALLIILVLMVPNPIRDRVVAEHYQNPETYARWQMWQSAVQQMVDYPFGIGLGLYQYVHPRYAFPIEGEITRYGKTAQTPHNEYLQMGVEMGVVSIVVFGAGVILIGQEAMKLLHRRVARWQRGILVGLSGGGLAILSHATIDSNLREPAIAILLILCVGLTVSVSRLVGGDSRTAREVPVRSRILWGTIATVILLVLTAEVVRLDVAWRLFEVASRHAAGGETEEAVKGFRQAAALDPGKSVYHHALASLHARMFERSGNEEAFRVAHAEYAEAMSLNPLDSRIPALMGQLHAFATRVPRTSSILEEQRVAQVRLALEGYSRAIGLAPFSALYRYEQIKLHWLLGEKGDAERQAKEVERLEPNFLPARIFMAQLALEENRIEEVKNQLREIQERQARYQHWQKNALEQLFLDVDVEPIRVAIDKKG